MKWRISERDVEVVNKVIDVLGLNELAFRRLTQLSGRVAEGHYCKSFSPRA